MAQLVWAEKAAQKTNGGLKYAVRDGPLNRLDVYETNKIIIETDLTVSDVLDVLKSIWLEKFTASKNKSCRHSDQNSWTKNSENKGLTFSPMICCNIHYLY